MNRQSESRQPVSRQTLSRQSPDPRSNFIVGALARFFTPSAGRNGGTSPEAPDGGRLIRTPAMDARFRRVCVVFAGGRCLIARGYEADARLRAALLALRQSGVIPVAAAEESASLEDIADAWRSAGAAPGRGRSGGAAA